MKVFILSVLVAVCYAQTGCQTPPARPVIAETFQAKVKNQSSIASVFILLILIVSWVGGSEGLTIL